MHWLWQQAASQPWSPPWCKPGKSGLLHACCPGTQHSQTKEQLGNYWDRDQMHCMSGLPKSPRSSILGFHTCFARYARPKQTSWSPSCGKRKATAWNFPTLIPEDTTFLTWIKSSQPVLQQTALHLQKTQVQLPVCPMLFLLSFLLMGRQQPWFFHQHEFLLLSPRAGHCMMFSTSLIVH